MKFGICCGIESAALVKEMGYDYFECTFSGIGNMTDEEFEDFKNKVFELDFYPEAMNVMLPGKFRLTGDEADLAPVVPFLEKAFARAAQLKTAVVVFGSGGARNVPEGFDKAKAWDQLVEYLNIAGDIAAKNGVNIAIEPLRFGESNIVNLVAEGAYLAARVNKPSVRCLADYYHVAMNEESCEGIPAFGHRLEHCHIARKEGRAYPLPTDDQDYMPFFSALKAAGYDKRLSVEGTAYNGIDQDGPKSLKLMKELISRL
ncbi:MAG: sugar phosphate isomerase/epimerase family protein [Christensenellales bacterium]